MSGYKHSGRPEEDLIEQVRLIIEQGWKAEAASRRTAGWQASPGGTLGAYNEGYADALDACAEALELLRDLLQDHIKEAS